MMSVVSMQRKIVLDDYLQCNEIVPEGVPFLVGVALTLVVPTLAFCIVSGELWPLYLMTCTETLGAIFGLVLYKNSSNCVVSCVSVTHIPNVPSGASANELKKAA